jgi:hypothetical protein
VTTTQPQPIPVWLPHIGPEVMPAATEALEIGYLAKWPSPRAVRRGYGD